MRITKREHSCLIVEENGDTLVIDPGSFSPATVEATDVVAIVITHEHPDHWTAEQLTAILQDNPEALIFAPAGVVAAASGFTIVEVSPGEMKEVGQFTLQFFGGKHAEIHSSIPIIDNVGVLVNAELYYAGDSYAVPEGVSVGTLAAPIGAPWLKIGDAMDFVDAIAPRRAFGVHETTLSDVGRGMSDQRLSSVVEKHGGVYTPLAVGQSLDV